MTNEAELTFGEWLKRQRKFAGWTQEQLAQQIGCSTIALRKIEAGERRPSEQIVNRLALIFKISSGEQETFLRFARRGVGETGVPHFSAPWNLTAPHSKLPPAITSFIGREKEIAELQGYLQNPNVRLITLIGPPGIGKTRLSIEAGRAAIREFPDGVFFIPLAPLNDPALIEIAVIQTLDSTDTRNQPLHQQLAHQIGDHKILLILDNCEHLIEEVAEFSAFLLNACPSLTLLATSREPLRVPGEWLYPVAALGVPEECTSCSGEEEWSDFSALTLFAERARAVRPDFRLTKENVRAVASICAKVDGLPLAIELLAARIRLMSPQSLLDQMSAEFILSANGMRAIPNRQKTLYNAISWSYSALSRQEQRVLNVCAVFSGGFTLRAAEEVCGESGEQPVAETVHALADKNLIRRMFNAQGEPRFALLQVIQQFVLKPIQNTSLEMESRNRHLAYFLQFAEEGAREIRGKHQVEWAERIQVEQNNLRAALEWAVSQQMTEQALRLLGALGFPWEICGYYREARAWLEKIRALPEIETHSLLLARVLNHIGRHQWTQENLLEARSFLKESCTRSAAVGDAGKETLAEALNWLGLLEIDPHPETARTCLETSLQLNRQCGNEWGIALSTFHLGFLESTLEHYPQAQVLLNEGLAMFEQFEDLFFISRVCISLGYVFLHSGEYEKAREYFERNFQIDTQLGYWDGIAESYWNLGNLFRTQGDISRAEEYYAQARVVCREHGLVKHVLNQQE